jgi:O-antigen ligase
VLAIFPVVALAICAAFRRPAGNWRALGIVLVVGMLVIGLLLTNVMVDAALALLGKDATLSGRTKIWSLVIVGLSEHIALGGGYGAGMVLVQPALEADFGGNRIGHAHNGYLDLAIDVGLVGLIMIMLIIGAIGIAAVRRFFGQENDAIAPLGIQYVIFYLLGNVAGSFLFNHNSIYLLIVILLYRGLVARTVSVDQATRRSAARRSVSPVQQDRARSLR